MKSVFSHSYPKIPGHQPLKSQLHIFSQENPSGACPNLALLLQVLERDQRHTAHCYYVPPTAQPPPQRYDPGRPPDYTSPWSQAPPSSRSPHPHGHPPARCASPAWTWPRKMESPKLDISSSLTHSLVQKQPGSPTVMSNVSGWGYKSTPSTRKWLTGLAVGSGSALDQYTPW